MKSISARNNPHKIIGLRPVLMLTGLMALNAIAVRANSAACGEAVIGEADAQRPKTVNPSASHKPFQLEFYGGFTLLNPSDLNLFVDFDNHIQEFTYDSYLSYLQASGQIRSWTMSQDHERRKIKSAFPAGLRLKFYFSDRMAVSLGFKAVSSRKESDLEIQYIRNELAGEQYVERNVFSPYSLSAKAYALMLGFHIVQKINKALTLEGYLSAGPLFADCHYQSQRTYEWWIKGSNYNWLTFSNTGDIEEKGSGTGIGLDLGVRLNYPLLRSLEIFLEGSYAYQAVKAISGPGKETWGESSGTWDGRWAIKEETIASPWGKLQVERPTAYWPNESSESSVRNFKLDLSGLNLRLGLSFRL